MVMLPHKNGGISCFIMFMSDEVRKILSQENLSGELH